MDPQPQSTTWLWFALGSAGFAALTNIFGKIGVAEIPSNLATWVRVIVIFVVTSLLVWGRGEWSNPLELPRRTMLFLVLSGVATGLSWLCGYRALQLGPASLVSPVDKLSVILVMIFGVLFLGEVLSARQWLGGGLILAGVLLVAAPVPPKPAPEAAQPAADAPTR